MYGYQYNGKGRGQIYSLFKISESAHNVVYRVISLNLHGPIDEMRKRRINEMNGIFIFLPDVKMVYKAVV